MTRTACIVRDAWCATMHHPQCSVTRVIWPCSSRIFSSTLWFRDSAKIGGQKSPRELSKKGEQRSRWLDSRGEESTRKNLSLISFYFLSDTSCSSYYRFRFEKVGHEILQKRKKKRSRSFRDYCGRKKNKKNRNNYSKYKIYIYICIKNDTI